MNYNRKIFYMNLYEGDEKKGNVGYIKVLESGEIQRAEARLSGISALFDGERELEILTGQKELAKERIFLQAGSGAATFAWEKQGELTGLSFRILLPDGCALDTQEQKRSRQEKPVNQETVMEEEPKSVLVEKEREEPEKEMLKSEPEFEEEKEKVEQDGPEKPSGDMDKVENRKWKQICKAYPHIQPFQDFRDYIKLDLKDMVLISERKYTLVENSFLLHGYYNYEHIILWRKEKAPVKYYIGVPGNFYEKEKQVAVLYGFESFEGAVEPAKEGDFGYYMTEVTI